MAQLKDLIVNGASQLIGDAIVSRIQITNINALNEAGGSTYTSGTAGQVLLSNGTGGIYWGSAAPTVTESTVSGWGFTKNTGTVTDITINTTSPLSGGSATASTTSGSWTIGFANQNANTVLAGPSSGNAAAPSFRALVAADLSSQIPVSHFNNDVGYLTSADVPPGASAYSGTITSVGTTKSNGSNDGFARGDHQHDISLATGDSNGQVKIAGTNVSVKGLGSNAYTSTAYLPLAGGTMTGGVTFVGHQSSAWNDKGIIFTDGSRIGENTSGQLGLYSASTFYLRPNSGTASSGKGIEISTTSLIPSVNNEVALGDSSHKWTTVYAATFNGNATTATNISGNKNANTVLAGPSSGNAASPSFRALVAADIPDLSGTYVAKAGSTMTGALTLSGNPTENMHAATKQYVDQSFQANDAMIFKGVVNSNSDLPATHYQGWTYRVGTAGTYAGSACEVGDLIICITDGTSANNAHWTITQTNLDGVVIGPASAIDGAIATYNGITGKLIQNSAKTITTSTPSSSSTDDTVPTSKAVYNETKRYLPLSGGTESGWVKFSGGGLQSSSTNNHSQITFEEDRHGNMSNEGLFLCNEGLYGNSDYYVNEIGILNDGIHLRGFDENDEGPEIKISKNGIVIDDGTTNGIGSNGQVLMSNGTKAYWSTVAAGGGGTVTQITAGAGLTTTTNGTTDGGNITGSGTLNLTACSTAATKGPTANVTGTNNTTIKVPKITIDKYGRVTALTEYTYTSKDTTYTLSGLGGIGTVNASGTAPLTLSATKNGTAVSVTGSVADASTSASGIVNTTTQHFAGNKGFNRISLYGIKDDGTSSQYSGYIKYYNAAETLVGEQWYDSGNNTNITTGQYYWREYSPNSTANTSTTGYYENYYLPAVDSGLSANKNYQILTTKNYPDSRYVQKSGDTMTGQLYINNTNDIDDAIAPGTAAPLVIGDKDAAHLEFDSNEIIAKSDGTTMTTLWLQDGNGPVHISGADTANSISLFTDGKIQANNNIGVKDTNNIGITTYINVSSAGNQGLYSSGYGSSSSNYTSSAKWIIRRNDAGDTYLGSGKVYVTDGNLYCSKSSATDTYIEATNSTGCRVEIDVSSNGQHGLWSSGYHNGTDYVASSLWLVTRSTDGNGYFNGISQSSKYLYITNSNEIRFDIKSKTSTANGLAIGWKWSDGTSDAKITGYSFYNGGTGLATITGSKVYGAVYNDYAEYREVKEIIKPGRCVIETGNGDLVLSTKRLERGCEIISDTYGFGIGETDKCKTPIAVTGRVLAYLLEDREYAKSHIGWPVCSGPNGTVSIMTEEEEEKYPSRIIGTISEIPDYEEWGSDSVKINGRIWIRVR